MTVEPTETSSPSLPSLPGLAARHCTGESLKGPIAMPRTTGGNPSSSASTVHTVKQVKGKYYIRTCIHGLSPGSPRPEVAGFPCSWVFSRESGVHYIKKVRLQLYRYYRILHTTVGLRMLIDNGVKRLAGRGASD